MPVFQHAWRNGIIVVLASLTVLFWPMDGQLPPPAQSAAALSILAIGFWATGFPGEVPTALIFFLGAVLLKAAPPDMVFSGFHSTAWWMVFGGLTLGMAVRHSGLGDVLAHRVARRLTGTYAGAALGVAVMASILALLMPSTMGRVMLLLPVTLALADRLGFAPGSKGRDGLILTLAACCYMPAVGIMPANLPNMVLIGAAETQHGIAMTYADWMIRHFPVMGALKIALILLVSIRLFAEAPQRRADDVPEGAPRPGRAARRLSLILSGALLLWLTDGLHGVSAAWVALGAAILCILPGIGMLPAKDFSKKLDFGVLLYVAGMLSIGAIADHSGLGRALADPLLRIAPLEPGADALNYATLLGIHQAIAIATTMPGVPAVMTPLAGQLAEATGWPIEAVLHVQVVAFACPLLPYQVPPVLVAVRLGNVSPARTLRMLAILWVASMTMLAPLEYMWWRAIGML